MTTAHRRARTAPRPIAARERRRRTADLLLAPFFRISSPLRSTSTMFLVAPGCRDRCRGARGVTDAVAALFDGVLVLMPHVLGQSLHVGTDDRVVVDMLARDRTRDGDGDPAIQ